MQSKGKDGRASETAELHDSYINESNLERGISVVIASLALPWAFVEIESDLLQIELTKFPYPHCSDDDHQMS